MMISAKRIEGCTFQVHFDGTDFLDNPYERALTRWMHGRTEKYSFDFGFGSTTVTLLMKEESLEEAKTFLTLVAIAGTTAFDTI